MLVLTNHNTSTELNLIPNEVDINFCVLSNETPAEADYYFPQLIMLESFYAPTLKLKIGKYFLNMPADFQILIGEPSYGDLEIMPVTSLSSRNFKAFCFNPLSSFSANYLPIDIEDVLPTTKWYLPKTRPGELVCIPLSNAPKPDCIYITRDLPKSMEIIRISNAW